MVDLMDAKELKEDNKISVSLLPNEYLTVDYKAAQKRLEACETEQELYEVLEAYKYRDYDLLDDYILDIDTALDICGKIGGVCYNKEGFDALLHEAPEKTQRRITATIENGHHSVYDHIYISFNMRNIPKLLAMVFNNEKQYTTSEKSARYTEVASQSNASISPLEAELYHKWVDIFKIKIKETHKGSPYYDDKRIEKLAMENARYLVSVFMPTTFIYTTSLRQINLLAAFMNRYIDETYAKYEVMPNGEAKNSFELKLADAMTEVYNELVRLNVLDPRLMTNYKNRKFCLFGENYDKKEEYFGDVYQIKYDTSYASLAQAQRHRTLDYSMERYTDERRFFVPPILNNEPLLVNEWLHDMEKVANISPQGEKVKVVESGKYEDFKLKLMERLCTAAQLEINDMTRKNLLRYRDELVKKNYYLKDDIELYTKGARCTFPGFTCTEDCHVPAGKTLKRTI